MLYIQRGEIFTNSLKFQTESPKTNKDISPFQSSWHLSRYRSTRGPRQWPVLLQVVHEFHQVFLSHQSFDAHCVCISTSCNTITLHNKTLTGHMYYVFSCTKIKEGHAHQFAQNLTPKTPWQRWWDWWCLQCCSLYNICLSSMDCYKFSMEAPTKSRRMLYIFVLLFKKYPKNNYINIPSLQMTFFMAWKRMWQRMLTVVKELYK